MTVGLAESVNARDGTYRLFWIYDHAVPVSKKEGSPLATPR